MKIQKRIAEFATQFVRKIFALYRQKNSEAPLVANAHEVSDETPAIDDFQLADPLNWEDIAGLIQNHNNLSNQYFWLTAKHLGMNWPDSLRFMQLKDLRTHSADELYDKFVREINVDEESTVLTTLSKVLFYWTKHTSESELEKLSPEKFVEETLENHIDATAAQVVFRRIDNQTLEEIGQSLGLTRERIRQIEKNTLQQINQLSEIDHFKVLLHSRQAYIENQLLGKHGCTRITDLPKNFKQTQLVSLSIKCLYGSLRKYADRHFVRFRNLYVRSGTDIDQLETQFNAIEKGIENLLLPMRVEMAIQELNVSGDALRWFVASTKKLGIFCNYVHKGRLTPRIQRGIQLKIIISGIYGGEPTSVYQLLSAYRFVFPNDPCSFRDIRITTFEFSHQIVSLCDAGYSAICKFVAQDDRTIAVKTQIPMLDAHQYRKFDSGILQTELANLVDEIGPAPLLTIRDEFIRRFGQKWSANSVFPTLKSTAYFSRMAPGIMGTLPMTDDPEKLTTHACLQTQSQVRIYTLAKLSKSRITYPLWNPEIEYQLCVWGDGNLPWKLYASLLSVTNPDAWPVSEDEKAKWKERIDRDGNFAISITPLQLSNTVPSIRDIFTLATFASNYSTISWMDINRVLGNRIDSRSSLSYVAILSLIGILHLPQNWLLPIEVNTRASYRFMNELVCNNRLQGSWRDVPEFTESNSDMKASWINPRELDYLLENMRYGKAEKSSVKQPDIFEDI